MALSKKCSGYFLVLCLLVLWPVAPLRAQDSATSAAIDSILSSISKNGLADSLKPKPELSPIDTAYQQENIKTHKVDSATWNKATKGLDYSPEGKKKKKEQHSDDSNPLPEISGTFIKYAAFAIIFVLLGFLIVYLLRSSLFLKNTPVKNRSISLLEDLEENLQESDLDKALREALENKDYRLALRIYYLAILKEMSLLEWIKYKRDKTNYEYVRELGMRPSTPMFRDITYTFERFWYGDAVIGEAEYKELSPVFSAFIQQIKGGERG